MYKTTWNTVKLNQAQEQMKCHGSNGDERYNAIPTTHGKLSCCKKEVKILIQI